MPELGGWLAARFTRACFAVIESVSSATIELSVWLSKTSAKPARAAPATELFVPKK